MGTSRLRKSTALWLSLGDCGEILISPRPTPRNFPTKANRWCFVFHNLKEFDWKQRFSSFFCPPPFRGFRVEGDINFSSYILPTGNLELVVNSWRRLRRRRRRCSENEHRFKRNLRHSDSGVTGWRFDATTTTRSSSSERICGIVFRILIYRLLPKPGWVRLFGGKRGHPKKGI